MKVDDVVKLHRIGDKMGMALKKRMVDGELNPEEPRDSLLRRAKAALRMEDWAGAASFAALLWFQDWRHHIGRDFVLNSDEPEDASTTDIALAERNSPSGEVVIFPALSRQTDSGSD